MSPLDALIGVVDLKNGQAVHAIAGNREHYSPLKLANQQAGDPLALINHYHSLGLRRFYLADLNALCGWDSQQAAIAKLLDSLPAVAPETAEVFLDDGASLSSYDTSLPLRRVLSTEAFRTPADWMFVATQVATDHLVLGLDLEGIKVRTANACATQSDDLLTNTRPWLQAARTINCHRVLVLDLQFVGTSHGAGSAIVCQELSFAEPEFQWLSGGGVKRGNDVQRLLTAGCSGILIGTALHQVLSANNLLKAVTAPS